MHNLDCYKYEYQYLDGLHSMRPNDTHKIILTNTRELIQACIKCKFHMTNKCKNREEIYDILSLNNILKDGRDTTKKE